MARDNLAMADDARRQWLQAAAQAVAYRNSGQPTERAVARAVRTLGRAGIKVVDYVSGRRTDADAAVRRHVRSQINQVGCRRSMAAVEGAGWDLVEVSSHIGARPSHAEWQGRVYSRKGGHPRYPDLYEGTGYEGVRGPYAGLADRLAGVNCRHSLGPYLEGQPRAYSPDPDADAGLRPGEAYEAAQRQRAIERRIRASKRQIAALEGSLEKGAANNDEIRNAIAAERVRLGNAQREMRGWVKSHQYLVREPGREKAAELDSQPRPLSARTRALRLRDERVAKGPNTVHMAAQNKHIPGTKEFAEKKASMERKAAKNPGGSYPGQSYFTMPADEVVRLVEDSVGKGEPSYGIDGDWYKRERCRASGIVGRVVEMDGGTIDTEWFTIHYSDSRGVHAVPAAPPKERP